MTLFHSIFFLIMLIVFDTWFAPEEFQLQTGFRPSTRPRMTPNVGEFGSKLDSKWFQDLSVGDFRFNLSN